MTEYEKLNEVFATTDDVVQKIVREILKIEDEEKYTKNIDSNPALEKDISERILKLINEEIR